MIQVFDSMALYGTGNPRLMAAGVASATLPTMTGMAVAVAGLLFYSKLHRWTVIERRKVSNTPAMDKK
jgi:biopolymer transport protein ExbB